MDLDVVEKLIKRGADVNTMTSFNLRGNVLTSTALPYRGTRDPDVHRVE